MRPGLDDKVLADWNGLMIAALANGGALLGEPGWIDMAKRAFDFIAADMTRGDRLGHSWRAGRLLFPGLASDFACMIKAALALYEATGERAYLDQALAWQRALDRHYANPRQWRLFPHRRRRRRPGGASRRRPLTTRRRTRTPSPPPTWCGSRRSPATMPGAQQADRLFDGVLSAAGQNLIGHAALLNALDLRLRGAEIVVTGSGARADALLAAARNCHFSIVSCCTPRRADALPAAHPARDKIATAPQGAAFVCVGERCSLPVVDAERLVETVRAMRA